MALRLVHQTERTAVNLPQRAVRVVVQDPVVGHADADDRLGLLVAIQVPRAVQPLGDWLVIGIAVDLGLLRLEHQLLAVLIPVPDHQRLRTVQLEQQRHVAVAVAVPVGEVDAPERLPRVALQRDGVGRVVIHDRRCVVIVEVGAVRVDAHQHVHVPAVAGDGAGVPDDAGNAPVVPGHIVGVGTAAAAAGRQTQAQQQGQPESKKFFHRFPPYFRMKRVRTPAPPWTVSRRGSAPRRRSGRRCRW